jgi:NIMA (never in mitosis gene a)-related kinase
MQSVFNIYYSAMEGLFLKIISGKYPPVPNFYSNELVQLLKDILNTDP